MNDHSILITGGRSPIAISIAQKMSLHSKVILLTRNIATFPLEYLNNGNILIREIDLLDPLCIIKVSKLIDELKIHSLCFSHRLENSTLSPQERFQGEVQRVYEIIVELIKQKELEEKRIIILTSPASSSVVEDQDFFYHSNRSSLSSLVRYIAVKFGFANLAINAIAPGSFVKKERSNQFYADNPELFRRIVNTIPSRKFTSPDDVSIFVKFLMTEAPLTLNGTELIIDSGLTLIEQSSFPRKNL